MISILSKIKNSLRNSRNMNISKSAIYDDVSGLYMEEYFTDILHLERKRSERTGKPFLLTLLNIEEIGDDYKVKIAKKIAEVLFAYTRETDIKGWFKYDIVIGIISTEIKTFDKEIIKKKITKDIYTNLSNETSNKIKINSYIFPEFYDDQKNDPNVNLLLYPDLFKKKYLKKIAITLKRMMDIIGSIIALILFSPLFVVISALVKISSEGPILFKQERLGQYGKKFIFLKFRTMYINSEPEIHKEFIKKFISGKLGDEDKVDNVEQSIYKLQDDPRVTPIGRFLRKTSLDEIPQFLNVLKGEMSLVGPRPPIPYELENYNIWHRSRIYETKPGITGLWQVNGRSSTTFNEMVRLDLYYARNWSLLMDIKIILKTPFVVLSGKGAY